MNETNTTESLLTKLKKFIQSLAGGRMRHIALNAEAIDRVLAGDDAAPGGGALSPGEVGPAVRRVCRLLHDAALVRRLWASR